MRSLFAFLLLTALLLASCARSSPEPTPAQTAATEIPTLPPTLPPPSPTDIPTTAALTFQPGPSLPLDKPLIAFETGNAQNITLFLADPAESNLYEFSFPAEARFATPFLAPICHNRSVSN